MAFGSTSRAVRGCALRGKRSGRNPFFGGQSHWGQSHRAAFFHLDSRHLEAPVEEGSLFRDARLLGVCGSTAVMMLGHGIAVPVVPLLSAELGASAAAVGAALSAFGVARLVANVPVGLAADKFGRKPLLIVGAFLSAVGTLASAFAPEIGSFVAARAVAGLGNAAYLGTAQIYLNDIAPRSKVARYIGANHAALLVGISIGPVLGGLAAEGLQTPAPQTDTQRKRRSARDTPEGRRTPNPTPRLASLRAPFFAVAALALLSGLHAHVMLTESRPDPAAAADAKAADAAVLRSILKSDAAAAAAAASPPPSTTPHGLLRDPRFVAAGMVYASTAALQQGGRNCLIALLAATVFDYSPGQVGALFGAMALVDLVAIGPSAWLADRLPARVITVPSLLGSASAAALCGVAAAGEMPPLDMFQDWTQHDLFLASVASWSLCTAALGSTLPAYAAALTPRENRGVSTALFRSCGDVGFVCAPILLGYTADAYGTREAMTALALVTCTAASGFAVFGKPPNNRR
ncbi:major facilitator superfamily domain-containing protein [Pelagophyceae sp. CCMP2097]|nr:major facilitator superfamily domain-containing protein [Pelagophyceae sp. CCMP2097]